MKSVIIGIVIAAGLGLVLFAFTSNASPYVDAATAMRSKGDNFHVAGEIVKGTLTSSLGKAAFRMKDPQGNEMDVYYEGEPVSSLGQSPMIVAVGGPSGGKFRAHQLLVKCPSKYTSAPTTGTTSKV
ncbi:MAG: cytochrome c maturation protein CcmE [Armatimonadota bacterium]